MADAARRAWASEDLAPLFYPRSIAVVGAARERGKVGRIIFDNLIKTFSGEVFPVNPKADEVDGRKCYSSISDIKRPIDLAIIAVPARFVINMINEAGPAGLKSAIKK